MILTVPVPPALNSYLRCFRNRMVKTAEARAYKGIVEVCWARLKPYERQALKRMTGDIAVTMRWYREAKRGDVDGRQKVLLDCLQGLAYANDKQIADLRITRFEDKANPRMEVEITPYTEG